MTTSGAIGQQAGPAEQVPPPARAGMANPAPWAVTAFATTSFMLGMFPRAPTVAPARRPGQTINAETARQPGGCGQTGGA
jgi:GPR1/FUN34/yaaH family